jgi:hypothetical protein
LVLRKIISPTPFQRIDIGNEQYFYLKMAIKHIARMGTHMMLQILASHTKRMDLQIAIAGHATE